VCGKNIGYLFLFLFLLVFCLTTICQLGFATNAQKNNIKKKSKRSQTLCIKFSRVIFWRVSTLECAVCARTYRQATDLIAITLTVVVVGVAKVINAPLNYIF